MRWLEVWHLRRRRDKQQEEVDWLRGNAYAYRIALEKAEHKLHEIQAELWAIEPLDSLLKPHREVPGFLSGR